MNRLRKKPKRLRQPHSKPQRLDAWLAGRNAELVVNRGELLTFVDEHARAVLVPLIADCIKAYDAERQRRVWPRRFLRWVRDILLGPEKPATDETYLAQQQAEREDAAEDEAPVEMGSRRSCVTCGSVHLMAVNERGGLRCDRGHVIEEPPQVEEVATSEGPPGFRLVTPDRRSVVPYDAEPHPSGHGPDETPLPATPLDNEMGRR